MRIGSLTGLAFQKYDRSEPRDYVTQHIPGYIQTFNYDLVSTNPTIQVDGTLVGTSAANLASQISTLKAMHRNRKVVWIDASDQYQGLLDFCRITKLLGPTVDSKTGPLIATFSLEAICLLPWGTTQFNPYSAPGVVLRDLSGVGHETVLNPLSMNCNFILSSALQSNQGGNGQDWFSWEFIVDNQNAYNAPSYFTTCDSTTGFTIWQGSGATISNDSVIFKQGTGSLKVSGSTDATYGQLGPRYSMPSGSLNLTNYDFYCLWVRCDMAGNATGDITGDIIDTSGNRFEGTILSGANANEWYRVVLPIAEITGAAGWGETGTVNLATINEVAIFYQGTKSAAANIWIDDIEVDTGLWTNLEFQIPDNLTPKGSTNVSALETYAWNGTSYTSILYCDSLGLGIGGNNCYALDGSAFSAVYNDPSQFKSQSLFAFASIGTSPVEVYGHAPSILYTTTYGCDSLFALSVKIPPATSDSQSGNLPSNDIFGFQAINKVRLRVIVYYSNGDT